MSKVTTSMYALMHDMRKDYVKCCCANGRFKTAEKIKGRWYLDDSDILINQRVKNGKYRRVNKHRTIAVLNNNVSEFSECELICVISAATQIPESDILSANYCFGKMVINEDNDEIYMIDFTIK